MFFVVTALCGWLGWETHRIRQRAVSRKWVETHQGVWDTFEATKYPGTAEGGLSWEGLSQLPEIQERKRKLSITRRLLGDTALMYIAFPEGKATKLEIERLRSLFPEALIFEVEIPKNAIAGESQ